MSKKLTIVLDEEDNLLLENLVKKSSLGSKTQVLKQLIYIGTRHNKRIEEGYKHFYEKDKEKIEVETPFDYKKQYEK